MKVTLTKIYKTTKDKAGNELKSKKGFPYTRMSIKTEEHGDKWISGFENKDNKDWKEGDTVEIEIKENGEYLNFETPKVSTDNTEVLNKLMSIKLMVTEIHEAQREILKALKITAKSSNAMGIDIPEEDLPDGDPSF